jgi:hypothetical protein
LLLNFFIFALRKQHSLSHAGRGTIILHAMIFVTLFLFRVYVLLFLFL